MNNKEIYKFLTDYGDSQGNSRVWFPGYYSTCQIVMDGPDCIPYVRFDGRGTTDVSESDSKSLTTLHNLLDNMKKCKNKEEIDVKLLEAAMTI